MDAKDRCWQHCSSISWPWIRATRDPRKARRLLESKAIPSRQVEIHSLRILRESQNHVSLLFWVSDYLRSLPSDTIVVAQLMYTRILFLCSQNKLRSPTAEAVFAHHPGIEVDSAGLNNDAVVPLSEEQVRWAELIVVMEKSHRNRLSRKFKHALHGKRVVILDIPDDFEYMEPALVALLRTRCAAHIPNDFTKPHDGA